MSDMTNPTRNEAARIEELETELAKKDQELSACRESLQSLNNTLDKALSMFNVLEGQLKVAGSQLKFSGTYVHEIVNRLNLDNKNLKISNDMWLRRMIKLELELLTVKEDRNKLERELAQVINKLN